MDILSSQYFLFAMAVLCVVTVYLAFVLLFRRNTTQARAERIVSGVPRDSVPLQSEASKQVEQVFTSLGVDIEKARKEWYVPLGGAGIAPENGVPNVLLYQWVVRPVLVLIGALMVFQALTGLQGWPKIGFLISGAMLVITGGFGVKLYLSNAKQKREKRMQRSFPDALDLLLICVESGLSLDTALAKVCTELRTAHPEMTDELERTRMELNVLNDRVQALQNLADRTNTSGFRSLVSSLMQSEKFGTSLADTLRVLADDFRVSRLLFAENKAARIPALITVPLIFFILPAFVLIIMGPPMIRINAQGGIFGDN